MTMKSALSLYRCAYLAALFVQNDAVREVQLTPQERVDAVRSMWEALPQEERVKLLSVEVEALRSRAKQLTEAMRQQQGVLMHGWSDGDSPSACAAACHVIQGQ